MMKNFFNDLKLSKLSYLLEIIEVRDFKSKIKAYNRIRQMKITKDMGLLILNETNFEHPNTYSDFNISLSLLSLLFKDYYEEYNDKLYSIYPKLTLESKYEVLSLLANCNKEAAIILYRDLVVKYGKELDELPIGTLSSNLNNYSLLFPELFKALKFDIKRNNILLLLNDFYALGVLKENDIKKNKKTIQTAINKILKEGANYKFKKDENIMTNKDYINLRVFLEAITNIEVLVSNKDSKTYLEKILKKIDNQLKLFILENYVKKGKDISKISLTTIAKDNLSRYPLYSFLKFYNLEKLMPKKYANSLALSESDLVINFCINYKYEIIPYDIKFLKEIIVDDYKYFVYRFTTDYNYYEEIQDPATDYILKNTSLDKTIKENSKVTYIGISGGFNKDIDPSLIEKNPTTLMVEKYNDDYDKIIDRLIPKKEIKKLKEENKRSLKDILSKIKKKEKIVKEVNKKEQEENKKSLKAILARIKNKDKVKKEKPIKEKKEKKIKAIDENIDFEEKEPSLLRRIFSFNTLLILVCLALVGSAAVLISYVNGMDILNLKNNTNDYTNIKTIKSTEINNEKYKEIKYDAIFNQEQSNYYVLFYKKKNKSVYHGFLTSMLETDYTVYFVDLNKEENKPIFEGNSTGFSIHDDTLLKVKDKEYEFYVVGKVNIVREMKSYMDLIEKQKEENLKKDQEEAEKKAKELQSNLEKDLKEAMANNKKKKQELIKKEKEEAEKTAKDFKSNFDKSLNEQKVKVDDKSEKKES